MATTRHHAQQEQSTAPVPLIGRDELNLAEFPIALTADYAPKGQKTIYFEDKHGRLTVTGSDAYGLPTATDADVIVALIYLTKLRNNFKDAKVYFSKYHLINLLNWTDDAWYYKRLSLSLNRWAGVLLVYDGCWWNNRLKAYTDRKMHIIEDVEIIKNDARRNAHLAGQGELPLSWFEWNKTFIASCQADNLRELNLDTYFSLKSAISKRLYRFLGKRFYIQGDWTFDLDEIAFDRVGLSRSYADAGKIKEKLQPAIDELEAIGFLRPLKRDNRYSRIDRGQWTIRLTRQSPALVAMPPAEPTSPLAAELMQRGVSAKASADLVAKHPAEYLKQKIEQLDYRMTRPKPPKEPAGYLVKSIVDDYAAPKGFESQADLQAREAAKQAKAREEAEESRRERQRKADEEAHGAAVEAYIKRLSPIERMALEAEILAQASPEARENYENPGLARYRDTLMLGMLREHVGRLLARQESATADA